MRKYNSNLDPYERYCRQKIGYTPWSEKFSCANAANTLMINGETFRWYDDVVLVDNWHEKSGVYRGDRFKLLTHNNDGGDYIIIMYADGERKGERKKLTAPAVVCREKDWKPLEYRLDHPNSIITYEHYLEAEEIKRKFKTRSPDLIWIIPYLILGALIPNPGVMGFLFPWWFLMLGVGLLIGGGVPMIIMLIILYMLMNVASVK